MDYSFDSDSPNDFGKLSKINSAGLVNSTISDLWRDFFTHFRNGKYSSANSDLECLWTIFGGEKNIKDDEDKYFDFEQEMADTGVLRDNIEIKGFGNITDSELNKLAKQKAVILKKALFLRRLQNKQGKGTAYSDGDEEEFD